MFFSGKRVCLELSDIPLIIGSFFSLQHFKQILIREKKKERTERSEEVDFLREKYKPLKCRKQIGFVAFGPDSEQAYNPWLPLCVHSLKAFKWNFKPARKKNHLNYLQATLPLPKLCSNVWYAVYCNTMSKVEDIK